MHQKLFHVYHDITIISQGLKGSKLPDGGIRIFSVALHTHLAGERLDAEVEPFIYYLTILIHVIRWTQSTSM